jgi:hypothetical protein
MAGMTSYLQKSLLDAFLDIAPYTMPTALYMSLHTADPGEAGSHVNEISTSGTGYARQSIHTKMGATDAVNGISLNLVTLTAGPALTDWGTVSYIGIEDASTAGNQCLNGAPTTAKVMTTGESFQLVPSQLSIQFQ